MGRRRQPQVVDERRIRLTTDEPIESKIQQILSVLVCQDLSISDVDVYWYFERTRESIKRFEEFPYYLYKAVWDEDFEPIQWGDHENGETILVNYALLDLYLNDHHYQKYRPLDYTGDFSSKHRINDAGQDSGNRLHYNMVEVFGFNEITNNLLPQMNLPDARTDIKNLRDKLKHICEKGQVPFRWIEYHHSDFFKADNQPGEPPKRKNSKFFKLCQTLKTNYRVRTAPQHERKTMRGPSNAVPVEEEPHYGLRDHHSYETDAYHHLPPYYQYRDVGQYYDEYDDLKAVHPSPVFSDANFDQESLTRAREDGESDINHASSMTDIDVFSCRSTVGSELIETN